MTTLPDNNYLLGRTYSKGKPDRQEIYGPWNYKEAYSHLEHQRLFFPTLLWRLIKESDLIEFLRSDR